MRAMQGCVANIGPTRRGEARQVIQSFVSFVLLETLSGSDYETRSKQVQSIKMLAGPDKQNPWLHGATRGNNISRFRCSDQVDVCIPWIK